MQLFSIIVDISIIENTVVFVSSIFDLCAKSCQKIFNDFSIPTIALRVR
jgi:hypothetical protein